MPDFGMLETVDLHEGWPKEAADFTPWLENHIEALGDVLGMDLDVIEREARVGGFSLDLLARDLGRSRNVVIENQLTCTDHRHLGQLLMYASGYDAGVVVWIAKEFTDEHRQTLDWLNRRTGEGTEFFGVVVELLKIDDSRPAPNFKLVAFPNEWSKEHSEISEGTTLSERQKAYREFFQNLIDELRDTHKFTGARKGQPQSWYYFSSSFGGINYGASFATGAQFRVELYIDREKEWNKWLFDELEKVKDILEPKLPEPLTWERLDDRNASRIAIYRPGSIQDAQETLDEIKEWSIEHLLRFKEVFGPKLDELTKQQQGEI